MTSVLKRKGKLETEPQERTTCHRQKLESARDAKIAFKTRSYETGF